VSPWLPAAQSQPAAQPVQKGLLHSESLGTITVTGSQMQALQAIKATLHRDYSMSGRNADKLVCHISTIGSSHVNKTLTCETNRQWWRREEVQAVQLNVSRMESRESSHPVLLALQALRGRNVAFELPINYSRFHALMKAVPEPASGKAGDQ
jgi:hypothetical protein